MAGSGTVGYGAVGSHKKFKDLWRGSAGLVGRARAGLGLVGFGPL